MKENISQPYVIEMLGITKIFPGIKANDSVNLQVKKSEIHALLGENGAGKSTLMSLLFGLYEPDEGSISINGKKTNVTNPNIATKNGIGMVHQHFNLVENFTVFENIILGVERSNIFGVFEKKKARKKIEKISNNVGLAIELDKKIEDIPVSMQQRVEILKMLYRDANILIFDEPTAVLTPQEVEDLLKIMESLVEYGNSIIFITHKLKEILAIADTCTVLRRGKSIGSVDVAKSNKEELAQMMVGRAVDFHLQKNPPNINQPMMVFRNISVKNKDGIQKLNDINLTVHSGEILGIAGIEGNGQKELSNIIIGLERILDGEILLEDININSYSIRERIEAGISCIPDDRHRDGLVLDFDLAQNIMLSDYYHEPFSKHNLLQFDSIYSHADKLIKDFDVRCGEDSRSNTAGMSGGNQQKGIIAREVSRRPKVLIAIQPTRGLDVGAIEYVHTRILQERDRGVAVFLISYDLDEILQLTDTVAVMSKGEIVEILETKKANHNSLGLAMAGVTSQKEEVIHKGLHG